MDIKLPFSLLNLFPCHSKYTEVHFSGSSKLNSWMEGGSPLPHLHVPPPPPPPAVQGERQSAILCFLAIYSYRACKQALLWYPVVRGWGREKGKSHHQSALGELARRLSILESSVQCRRGSCLPSYHYVEHLFSGLFCKHVSWMLDIQLLIQQIWFVLVKECYSEELHTSDPQYSKEDSQAILLQWHLIILQV